MKKKEKKSLFASFKFKLFLVALITIVASSALTYSYIIVNKRQSESNKLETTCFNVEFEEGESISLENAVSVSDTKGQKSKPYTFTITNTCDNETHYSVILSTIDNSFDNEFVSYSLNQSKSTILKRATLNRVYSHPENYSNSYILKKGVLKKDETVTYDLRLWINSKATYDDVKEKPWNAEIKVMSGIKEVEEMKWLSTKIPALARKQELDLTKENESGIYKVEDLDGTSYVYHGNVETNHVSFADMNWRIVRLNGDGSLRLIYDGVLEEPIMPLQEGIENNIETTLNKWFEENIQNKYYNEYIKVTAYSEETKESSLPTDLKCSDPKSRLIGLLSKSEVEFVGLNSYIKRDVTYWLSNRASDSELYTLTNEGIKPQDETTTASLVPVINIKAEFLDNMIGTGTESDPYRM